MFGKRMIAESLLESEFAESLRESLLYNRCLIQLCYIGI